MPRGMRRYSSQLLLALPSIATILVFLGVPILIMAYVSVLRPGESMGIDWKSKPNLDSYAAFVFERDFDDNLVFTTDYLRIFLRSALQSLSTTAICFLIGFPTALWMSTQPKSVRNLLLFMVTIPFWTNLLIRNYAWILILRTNGVVDNLLKHVISPDRSYDLLYTDFAVAVGLTYTFLPFMTLPIYASLEKLDWRLVEAGYDLGANRRRVLLHVIIPLVRSGIFGGCLIVFVPSLGAYVIPELLGGGKKMMIGNLIGMQFGAARNWPFGATLSQILLAIVLVAMLAAMSKRSRSKPAETGAASAT